MQSSIPVIPITSGAGRYFWIGGLKSMVVKWQISIPQEKKSNCLDSIFSYKEWVLIEFQYIYFIHHEQFTGYRDGCMLQVHRHWQGWFSTRAKELNLLAKECATYTFSVPSVSCTFPLSFPVLFARDSMDTVYYNTKKSPKLKSGTLTSLYNNVPFIFKCLHGEQHTCWCKKKSIVKVPNQIVTRC